MKIRETLVLALCVLGIVPALPACATAAMADLAFSGDRAARVTSAWTTDSGGLVLVLAGMEADWSQGEGMVELSTQELGQALAQEGARSSDDAQIPQVLLPRSRLILDWSPEQEGAPVLLHEVPVEVADAAAWAGVHAAGVDADGRSEPWRLVYRSGQRLPRGDGERGLAVLVVSPDATPGEVRRAVFLLASGDRGALRKAALLGLGVVVDLGMVALLTL